MIHKENSIALTWQLGRGRFFAERLKTPIACDFRSIDTFHEYVNIDLYKF